jgi:hypothetical protein
MSQEIFGEASTALTSGPDGNNLGATRRSTDKKIYAGDSLRLIDLSIPLGEYILDIRTKAGGWFFESLTLSEQNGTLHQNYYI